MEHGININIFNYVPLTLKYKFVILKLFSVLSSERQKGKFLRNNLDLDPDFDLEVRIQDPDLDPHQN